MSLRSVAIGMARNEIGERPFARGDDSFDRIDLRNGCEWSRGWPDQIAYLIVSESSDAIDRRNDLSCSRD